MYSIIETIWCLRNIFFWIFQGLTILVIFQHFFLFVRWLSKYTCNKLCKNNSIQSAWRVCRPIGMNMYRSLLFCYFHGRLYHWHKCCDISYLWLFQVIKRYTFDVIMIKIISSLLYPCKSIKTYKIIKWLCVM